VKDIFVIDFGRHVSNLQVYFKPIRCGTIWASAECGW